MFFKTNFSKLFTLSILIYPLSLVNQIILSWRYGVSVELDAYWLCLFGLLFTTVPVYTAREAFSLDVHSVNNKNNRAKSLLFSSRFNMLLIVSLIIGLFLLFWEQKILILIAPTNPKIRIYCSHIFPILTGSVFFLGINESLSATLTLYGESTYAQWARLLGVMGSIVAVAGWGKQYGVLALAWGAFSANFFVMILELFALKRRGIFYIPWTLPRIPRIFIIKSLPLLTYLIFMQGGNFLLRCALQQISDHTISAYQYALSLYSIPENILVFSIHGAFWAFLGSKQAGKDISAIFFKIITLTVFALGCATTIIWLFNVPIIRLFLMRGTFNSQALQLTSYILRILAWGLIPQALALLLGRYVLVSESLKTAGVGWSLQALVVCIMILVGWQQININIILFSNTVGAIVGILFFARCIQKKNVQLSVERRSWILLGIIICSGGLFAPSIQLINTFVFVQWCLLFCEIMFFVFVYFIGCRALKIITRDHIKLFFIFFRGDNYKNV